jgi:hypothetical protein
MHDGEIASVQLFYRCEWNSVPTRGEITIIGFIIFVFPLIININLYIIVVVIVSVIVVSVFFFVVCVVLCSVLFECGVLFCVMCVIVLVQLPPGKTPFAV